MSEPTATNSQTGEKLVLRGGQWVPMTDAPTQPNYPSVIRGQQRPFNPTPFQVEDQEFKREDQQIQREKNDLERQRLVREQAELKDGQAKAAGFLQRAVGANTAYEGTNLGPRSLVGEVAEGIAPRIVNKFSSDGRQQAEQAERDFIAAVLRLESGAAISPQEFESQALIYFPQPGDGEAVIKQKAEARRRALEQLRLQAGTAGEGVTFEPYATPAADEEDDGTLKGTVSYEGETYEQEQARKLAEARAAGRGESDASVLMRQGVTLGLSDEVAGIGTAIGRGLTGDFNLARNYRIGRDADRINNERARENLGWGGTAIEAVSGVGSVGSLAGKAGSLMKQGAGLGALGGFGYGEGLAGSGGNALVGTLFGGSVGLVGQKATNALANRAQASGVPQRAAELNAAGQAEGVKVNRAMVDPRSNNAVTKADATLIGGRKVQGEMSKIEGQIEGRVTDLGRGGQAMDNIALGDKVKGAGERFIEKSGKAAKVKYDRAEKLAGNAKVTPKESLAVVDDAIATLSQTPGTNAAEIRFLESLKSDLSQDLSVGALRRMRTSLRKKISRGELVFGEDEARVLSIMDAAADDIRVGLTAQGNAKAAKAFDSADKAYRARMEYINGTVQKLLGKRNANPSAEQIASKFNSLAKSDARSLRKFYATLEPDEAADVAATFAERLGTNNKDGFTVTQFLRQTSSKNMSDEALKTIFGKEGAESVRNLRTLGREVERVTGAMNSRTSKSGVANYRDWLINLALGGGGTVGGLVSGSATTGVALGAAAAGANTAASVLSARALMSPKITKWLAQAPNTTTPAAIDAHFARLQAIAKAEPALAAEIKPLQDAIMKAANDNVGISAAAGDTEEDKRNQ